MPLAQVIAIAKTTFVEAIRQPIYFFLIALCGVIQIFNTWGTNFSMAYETTAEVSADDQLLLDIGMGTIFGCGVLLAAFIATATISREIENKTALTVVSKPVGRAVVVIGKYLGVTGAIIMATAVMLIFLLLSIRHGVLTTAADDPDQPVILFSFIAGLLTLGLAAWCNYFYGWSFTQVASVLVLPAFFLAYLGVLAFGKEWRPQPLGTDFKPYVTLACGVLALAILVLTSVAVAVSTRLGQVMTIIVCAGLFLFGLLANHLVGRGAMDNKVIAYIQSVESVDLADQSFSRPGQRYTVVLDGPPNEDILPGSSFFYGENPNGFRLAVPPFAPFEGDPEGDVLGRDVEPAIIVTGVDGLTVHIRHIGGRPLNVRRPPMVNDAVFLRPTEYNPVLLTAWVLTPNMQFFWLMDAIAQNRTIPAGHVAMVAMYALLLIVAFLALGVALFQRRDVG